MSEKEREEISIRYQAGESTYQLAEAFNCHRSTISRTVKAAGIKVGHYRVEDAEVIELYESGLTSCQIAKMFNTSGSVILRTLRKNGVVIRKRRTTTAKRGN